MATLNGVISRYNSKLHIGWKPLHRTIRGIIDEGCDYNTICMVYLASIKFGDFAQIKNWWIFSLANRLMMWIGEHLIWRCVLQPRERMEMFKSEQVVCGHHVYKAVWMPFIGEELICCQESGNASDLYAVAVLKPASSASSSPIVVGHVPWKISAACSGFLEFGGTIRCTITGPRQYSTDLRQGGLDVPCKYTFIGENPHLSNVARLVKRFSMLKKRKLDG